MWRVSNQAWFPTSLIVCFLLAYSITRASDVGVKQGRRSIRFGLYVAALLGIAHQLWVGVAAGCLIIAYQELTIWADRRR